LLHFIAHSDTHTYSPGRVIDQSQRPVPTQHDKDETQTSMPPARFETAIPATERPQSYALDSTATEIGMKN
jgi:hypothetical protein